MLDYIIRFIIGGTIITLIHYFGTMNNTKILALLPFIPIYFIFAYFYVCKKGKIKINAYLFNLLIFLTIYALFVISVIFIYNCSGSIIFAPRMGYIIWIILVLSVRKYLV